MKKKSQALFSKHKTLVFLLQWALTALMAYPLSFVTSSCSSIDCPVQNTVATYYSIRDAEGNEETLADTLWIWSRRKDGRDTLINSLTGKSAFSLPVSYSNPEDTLVFCVADSNHVYTLDTLWLKKDDIPHFESVDCSPHFFHHLTNVRFTRSRIDSIKIVDPRVDYNQSKTHLHVWFRKIK